MIIVIIMCFFVIIQPLKPKASLTDNTLPGLGKGGSAAPPGIPSAYSRFGACDAEEKKNCIFREMIYLRTDTTQFQYLNYNVGIIIIYTNARDKVCKG